ncbi:uncharacterized protein PAC_12240 [Phialocephala subalpina]|uniref:Uncharacterized protein n=1 Tax=Phialocephala subalpina TaxID=576137 RepID=A0A1L7XBE6_9HELO|nr:uncharacterized protein PAC_12240 [Phialocephala subalpina]
MAINMEHFCDHLCIVRHDAADPSKAIISFQDFETAYNKYHAHDLRKVARCQAQGKKVRYTKKNLTLVYQQFWRVSNPYRSMIVALWERAEKFGMSPAKFDYLWRLTEFYVPEGESAAHNRWMRERTMWKDTGACWDPVLEVRVDDS